jgi:hypothetical protein
LAPCGLPDPALCLPKSRTSYATVLATSMSVSMLLFSLGALLMFLFR